MSALGLLSCVGELYSSVNRVCLTQEGFSVLGAEETFFLTLVRSRAFSLFAVYP